MKESDPGETGTRGALGILRCRQETKRHDTEPGGLFG